MNVQRYSVLRSPLFTLTELQQEESLVIRAASEIRSWPATLGA